MTGATIHLGVITGETMFAPLLLACPSFAPTYEAFLEHWRDSSEKPHYLALSDLARHLVERLEAGDTGDFPAVFADVERWLFEGDRYVREAATVGLLEDLQNTSIYPRFGTTAPRDILPWLEDKSRQAWADVEAYWERGVPIPDR